VQYKFRDSIRAMEGYYGILGRRGTQLLRRHELPQFLNILYEGLLSRHVSVIASPAGPVLGLI
jgi:hypothetical protein